MSGVGGGGLPVGLSCGHSVCGACGGAMVLGRPPVCVICREEIGDEVVLNAAFGEYCDGVRVGREGGEAREEGSEASKCECN